MPLGWEWPDLTHRLREPDPLRTQTGKAVHDPAAPAVWLAGLQRSLGSERAIVDIMVGWSARWPKLRPTTILDLSGSPGELACALSDALTAAKRDARIVIVEPDAGLAKLAKSRCGARSRIEVKHADPRSLLKTGGPWDYVVGMSCLHRLEERGTAELLDVLDRVSQRGLCFTEVERSRTAGTIVGWLARSAPSEYARRAARLLHRQGFTRHELGLAADSAGMLYLDAWYDLWGRVRLSGERRDL